MQHTQYEHSVHNLHYISKMKNTPQTAITKTLNFSKNASLLALTPAIGLIWQLSERFELGVEGSLSFYQKKSWTESKQFEAFQSTSTTKEVIHRNYTLNGNTKPISLNVRGHISFHLL